MTIPQYLTQLLDGLDTPFSTVAPVHALRPVAATAWGEQTTQQFSPGKLGVSSVLPGSPATPATNWSAEQSFVAQLYQQHPRAGAYTYYYLAQAWATRRAATSDGTTTLFDHNRWEALKASSDELLFIKGSISGIQRYIYDNVKSEQIGEGEQTAKRLRGRSFLVALLGEWMAEYLVDQLDLTPANILFVGGGHFNVVIPADRQTDLQRAMRRVDRDLLVDFNMKLGIVTAMVPFAPTTPFADVFVKANDQLERVRQRRFAGELTELYFDKTATKQLVHLTAPTTQAQKQQRQAEETQMQDVGRWLPKTKFMLTVVGKDRAGFKRAKLGSHLDLPAMETTLVFLRTKQRAELDWSEVLSLLQSVEIAEGLQLKLHVFNATDFLPPTHLQAQFLRLPLAYGFRMLGKYAPTYGPDREQAAGTIQELSDLAALDQRSEAKELSYQRIAAMRLDIDDLGALFSHGFGSQPPLTDVLAMSRELQLFFGGHINQLAEKHQLYIVYSGGDDAFVLGSWINVLHFALDMRRDFSTFTADNPAVGFSAGIFMANPKYPITRLAQDAGNEEGLAKNHREAKNTIRVFGHSMSWQRYAEMLSFATRLLNNVKERHGIRRSVLQHLIQIIHKAKKGDPHEFYLHLGRLHALLVRRKLAHNDLIEEMLKDTKDFDRFQDYLLPFHYVLYKTR